MIRRRAVTAFAAGIAVCAATGCAAPTVAEDKLMWPPARFIVKPRAPVASDAEILALVRSKLAQPERVRLYRPMSGGAYVFEIVPPGSHDDLPAIVRALSASGAFEYVEIDAPATIR